MPQPLPARRRRRDVRSVSRCSELELHSADSDPSGRGKAAFIIILIEKILASHEKPYRLVFGERNSIADAPVHFVRPREAVDIRHIAEDRFQVIAGGEG